MGPEPSAAAERMHGVRVWVRAYLEGHALLLDRVHGMDDELVVKVEVVDALKALFEVRLHARGVLREEEEQGGEEEGGRGKVS